MAHKLPDLALRLAALGKPTFVNGRWRKPPLSRRQLADVRKILILQGADIPLKPLRNRGGDKPLKLRKWERNKESRQALIEENMKKMPEMVAEYRRKMAELRQKTKKKRTEEEEYLLATRNKGEDKPAWQILKEMTGKNKK